MSPLEGTACLQYMDQARDPLVCNSFRQSTSKGSICLQVIKQRIHLFTYLQAKGIFIVYISSSKGLAKGSTCLQTIRKKVDFFTDYLAKDLLVYMSSNKGPTCLQDTMQKIHLFTYHYIGKGYIYCLQIIKQRIGKSFTCLQVIRKWIHCLQIHMFTDHQERDALAYRLSDKGLEKDVFVYM